MSRLKELRKYIDNELNKLDDADAMHHIMNDLSKPIKEKEQTRYDELCKEFGLE
jgi:hypothetical protein